MNPAFLATLKQQDWIEIRNDWEYKKGTWTILRDTGAWWMISIESKGRIFDFPEPTDYTARWTVNLIELLCKLNS